MEGKDESTQAYKSYADYDFPNDETCHPHCENSADYILCTPTNDEFQYPIGNVYCGSVLPVLVFTSKELKWIHRTEHQ